MIEGLCAPNFILFPKGLDAYKVNFVFKFYLSQLH